MAVTFWARFCSLFFPFFFLFASNLFDQAATSRRECCTFPACHTHLHMLPASGQWLFIIHSTICLAGRRGADHWSVHLSLSCPLYLTVEINGKHPERTRTRRCITACQAVPNSRAASLHFDSTTAKSQAFIRQIAAWLKTVKLTLLLWASRNIETSIISTLGWFVHTSLLKLLYQSRKCKHKGFWRY